MGAIGFVAELLPYLLKLAEAGGNVVEAIQWGDSKVQGWKASGTEPTEADFAELQARRHANDAIINQG